MNLEGTELTTPKCGGRTWAALHRGHSMIKAGRRDSRFHVPGAGSRWAVLKMRLRKRCEGFLSLDLKPKCIH